MSFNSSSVEYLNSDGGVGYVFKNAEIFHILHKWFCGLLFLQYLRSRNYYQAKLCNSFLLSRRHRQNPNLMAWRGDGI